MRPHFSHFFILSASPRLCGEMKIMPSGKVHAQCSLVLAVPAFGLVAGATGDNVAAGACALGCLLGIMLTPDLDQEGLSSSENALIKYTLGLGFLWAMLMVSLRAID